MPEEVFAKNSLAGPVYGTDVKSGVEDVVDDEKLTVFIGVVHEAVRLHLALSLVSTGPRAATSADCRFLLPAPAVTIKGIPAVQLIFILNIQGDGDAEDYCLLRRFQHMGTRTRWVQKTLSSRGTLARDHAKSSSRGMAGL
jgi:hypothetical protein